MKKIKEIRAAWKQQPDSFPVFLKENLDIFPYITSEQKKENEALIQEFSRRIQKKIQKKPGEAEAQRQWEEELEQEFCDFLQKEKMLSLSEWMSRELLDAFTCETKRFVNRVRSFDETLNEAQIWQTLRNYFIYAMIVEMQGEAQNAKNPILAYSLLYPYTDNYIDDEQILPKEKERYNRMIASRLKEEPVFPQNPLEEKTCRLLDMILNEYKGMERKKVTWTLLQLLEAQNSSIRQQKAALPEEEILDISIRKGSASVLADYLFSTVDWLEYEEVFYLKFGFLLQLVDDLQDIEEDRRKGSQTLMTTAYEQQTRIRGQQYLEQRVNRLLWFSWNVIREFKPRNPGLKGFILKNCVEITLLTAAINPQFFSKKYLLAIEPYLPLSLEFLKKMKKQQYMGR